MSRGRGRIERAIIELFESRPDDAYSTEDLIEHVFPVQPLIEKKHRVSVLRAASKVVEQLNEWEKISSAALGSTVVFWTRYNVMSYAAMRVKGDKFSHYRSRDVRVAPHTINGPAEIAAMFAEGGKYHHHVIEGGAWWSHVQLWIAERDGHDSETVRDLWDVEIARKAAFSNMLAGLA